MSASLSEIRHADANANERLIRQRPGSAHAHRRVLLRLLDEMTLCRDNAVRAAERMDQPIEFDIDGQLRDGLAGIAEWDEAEPDRAPDRLINAVVRVVRPELARLTEQRDAFAGMLDAATGQFGLTFQQLADADEDNPTPELIEAGRRVRDQICGWLAEHDTGAPDFHHCAMCGERCYWQESPHGGWWAHEVPSGGDHDAVAGAPCRPGADDYCEPATGTAQNGPVAPAGDPRPAVDAHGGEVAQRGAAGREKPPEAERPAGPWAWAESLSWAAPGTFTIPISRPTPGGDIDADVILDRLAAEVLHAMLGDLLSDHSEAGAP